MSKVICEICGEEVEDRNGPAHFEARMSVDQDGEEHAAHLSCLDQWRLWDRLKSLEVRVDGLEANSKPQAVEIRESAGHPEGLEDQR